MFVAGRYVYMSVLQSIASLGLLSLHAKTASPIAMWEFDIISGAGLDIH